MAPITDNANIFMERVRPLPTPGHVKQQYPVTPELERRISAHQETIKQILRGDDPRFLAIVGPCSVHHLGAAIEYATWLWQETKHLRDRLYPVIRLHVEKPRTLADWPGIFYDPVGDRTGNIRDGIMLSRQLIWSVAQTGLPVSTEIMTPDTGAYLGDLLSFFWIGARTSESPYNRWIVSGLTAPFGVKNGTGGGLDQAAEGIVTIRNPHSFIGPNEDGITCEIPTRGNSHGIMVLRGGASGPNYTMDGVAAAKRALRKHGLRECLLIDTSHGNSNKDISRVPDICRTVARSRATGEESIRGVAIEGWWKDGKAEGFPATLAAADPYLSLTDPCIGVETTKQILNEIHAALPCCERRIGITQAAD